ncbi:MAG: endonuclease domain-containing protein [Litorimonas sp.]
MTGRRNHFSSSPQAKQLRDNQSEEEIMLWKELKSFRSLNCAFRRQAKVGPYIADFLCRKAMLIIEVDGHHHDTPDRMLRDKTRDLWMVEQGYRVIRIDAKHVWQDMGCVIEDIEATLNELIGTDFGKSL